MPVLTHEQRTRRRRDAARAVSLGIEPTDVAKKYDMTVSNLRRACKEFRIRWPEKMPGGPIGSSIKILAGILTGHSVDQICRKLGCKKSRVYAVKKEAQLAGRLVPGRWPTKFPGL